MEQLLRDEWVINWLIFMEACEIYDDGFYTNMTFKRAMSKSSNITMEFIDSNPDFGWDYDFVSENPNLTLDYVLLHYDLPWDWFKISKHKNVTLEMILENNGCYWYVEAILQNPNVTLNMIQTHEYFTNLSWNEQVIRCVMKNKSMTMDDIEALMKHKNYKHNYDYEYEYYYLCSTPNITYDFVMKNRHLLNIDELCKNTKFIKSLTQTEIETIITILTRHSYANYFNPQLAIKNMYFSMNNILKMPFDDFDFSQISENENLTIEFIKSHINDKWNRQNLWINLAMNTLIAIWQCFYY